MASCLKGRISALLLLLSCCTGQVFGQSTANHLASHGVPGFQASPYGGVDQYNGNQKWDYRFAPQFQSTIKPYLRWYMRYNPTMPGNRVLPRDFGYGVNYGYASYGHGGGNCGHSNSYSTCGPQCGGDVGYSNSYGDGRSRPSLYWNHIRYLRDMYGHTEVNRALIRRPRTPGSYRFRDAIEPPAPPRDDSGYDTDPPELSSGLSGKKNVWIARNEATGTFSILFHAPPAAQADKFASGIATLAGGAKIVDLEWTEKPAWEADVRLVDGRLQPRI